MSAVKKITKAEAIRLLEQAVQQRGRDYIDPAYEAGASCTYVKGDSPACIVGHALHFAGVPLPVLEAVDTGTAKMTWGDYSTLQTISVGVSRTAPYYKDVLDYVEEQTGVVVTPAARRVFSDAQNVQDGGDPWGKALTAARRGDR